MKNVFLYYLLLPSLLAIASCNSAAKTTNNLNPVNINQIKTSPSIVSREVIEFKNEAGTKAFPLKILADGAKLINGNNKEIARLSVDEKKKVKIKNSYDAILGYIVYREDRWKIEDGKQQLYILQKQADGDYKLKSGQNKEIYRIKVRDYGYEIETPSKQSLYKIKVKDGKTSLRNKADKTLLYTKSSIVTIAFVCFGFDVLKSEQKAALTYSLNRALER